MILSALIEIKGNLINQTTKKQNVELITINARSTHTSLPKCQNGSCQELAELLVVMLLSMLPLLRLSTCFVYLLFLMTVNHRGDKWLRGCLMRNRSAEMKRALAYGKSEGVRV